MVTQVPEASLSVPQAAFPPEAMVSPRRVG